MGELDKGKANRTEEPVSPSSSTSPKMRFAPSRRTSLMASSGAELVSPRFAATAPRRSSVKAVHDDSKKSLANVSTVATLNDLDLGCVWRECMAELNANNAP